MAILILRLIAIGGNFTYGFDQRVPDQASTVHLSKFSQYQVLNSARFDSWKGFQWKLGLFLGNGCYLIMIRSAPLETRVTETLAAANDRQLVSFLLFFSKLCLSVDNQPQPNNLMECSNYELVSNRRQKQHQQKKKWLNQWIAHLKSVYDIDFIFF